MTREVSAARRASGRGRDLTRTRATLLGVGLVLAGVLGPGCAGPSVGPPENRCAGEADCPTGTCDVELGMCVSETRSPMRVALEVHPVSEPFAGSPVPVSYPPFDLVGPTVRELAVPVGVPTSGRVDDRSTGMPVTADVTFVLSSRFEGGQSFRTVAQSQAEFSRDGRDDYRFNFATQLLPASHYQIAVSPTGVWKTRRPPMRFSAPYETPGPAADGTTGAVRLEFLTYPEVCRVSDIGSCAANDCTCCIGEDASPDACLVELDGFLADASGDPEPGMLVRAVRTTGGEVVSSTFTTSAATGEGELAPGVFRLTMPFAAWSAASGWLFEVIPTSERVEARGPTPSFTVDPNALTATAGRATILTPSVGGSVSYSGWVESELTGETLSGATLTFTATDVVDGDSGVVGRFSATTTTGDDGAFSVTLLSGSEEANYEVVVTPAPTDEGVAVLLRDRITLGAGASGERQGHLFRLPQRASLGGIVQTGQGLAMLDARVRGRPRAIDFMDMFGPVARHARPSDTLTDSGGRFGLRLDVGVYDIVVEPPLGTNFPWLVAPDMPIGTGAPSILNVYEIEAPVTVTGVAAFTGPDGPLAAVGAEVRAYALIGAGDTARAVQIGRAETNEEGGFALLLPPGLRR